VGGGQKATSFNGLLEVSYEFRQNLFFELTLLQRNYSISGISGNNNATTITAGVRLNMFKRTYDF